MMTWLFPHIFIINNIHTNIHKHLLKLLATNYYHYIGVHLVCLFAEI
jgi:hypothetical protein